MIASYLHLTPAWMHSTEFALMLAGFAVTLCIVVLFGGFSHGNRHAARIRIILERRQDMRNKILEPRRQKRADTHVNFMRSVVMKFKLLKTTQVDKTQARLVEAGYRSKDAIYILAFFNLALPILCTLGGMIVSKFVALPPRWHMFTYFWPVLGAYIGFKIPGIIVSRVRKKRYLYIQRSLADVLDLMTICAEAGLSLATMLERVSKELAMSYPEMAQEMKLTAVELGFLPDRHTALSNLATRCQLPEVRGMVSVLIQTEKYGTPIAQALRVLGTEFRQARMLRAEQKAARLPALMTVPMITFILPTLFIIIMAPAIVKLLDTIGK